MLSGDGLATPGLTINCSQGQATVIGDARREGERILAKLLVSVPALDLRGMKKDAPAASGSVGIVRSHLSDDSVTALASV